MISETTTTSSVDQPTEARPTLTLQDLSAMLQALGTASTRGVWKANELSTVGGLYDRIAAFLAAAHEAQGKSEETE
jgi:hypothetical protein